MRRSSKLLLVSKKTLFTEVRQEFIQKQEYINKTFNFEEYSSRQECSSLFFGHTQIEQKCYICSKCDSKGQYYICRFCYENCHNKCRPLSEDKLEFLLKKEYLNYKRFECHCGVNLKHIFESGKKSRKSKCNMMYLDQNLNIGPYECITHNQIICCICAVNCHSQCNINYINEIDDELSCECDTDYHSNFNEFALSFPLEQYTKVTKVDIWPIQILNILFSTKTTFSKLALFFHRTLSNEADFKNMNNNIALINKFENLLKLFSDSFNRKFKTYYYHEEMSNMFPFKDLFNIIKKFEVTNSQTAIIRFRLLFILLFLHLRKDFNTIKSLTSNDFYCNTVLERLKYKKILKSDKIFSYEINEKYNLNGDSEVKKFVLISICDLITKGMNFVSIEENQDEFEIGLKLITFMLKRMIFDKNDIIRLIDSIYDFHSNFYVYIIGEDNNIYSLIDIFNGIVEICFIISVYYNDLIIEEFLDKRRINKNDLNKTEIIGKFIHTKNDHSIKLFTILLKNCDLITKHFDILIKPNLDKKSKEEIRRENIIRKNKIAIQNQILLRTTGVPTKMPENNGLFTNKIINLFIENLSLFSLADNFYQKKLNFITNDDINDYYKFCENLKNDDFYEIMNIEQGKHHSNILYNLKLVLDDVYSDLFITSYIKQKDKLDQELRSNLLNAIDQININIKKFKKKSKYKILINNLKKQEKELKKNAHKNNNRIILDEAENFKRKILKELIPTINFTKSNFLLINEGRELLVDNLIISQIDEILFKGMFFLSNIHYPNIITPELYDLFFKFLSLFLLTKNGTIYIITGKNLQIIQKLINRLRYDEKNKNINNSKKRTLEFNLSSLKIVLHFLYNLTKMIDIYNIKSLKGHKALIKFHKNILTHLKFFLLDIKNNNKESEFKHQLKETLEIFSNLYPHYTYNQYEKIKIDIIDLFNNKTYNLLKIDLFQNLFDKSVIYNENKEFIKQRNIELSYYFHFFKIVTKNSYYIYKIEENKEKKLTCLKKFIDMQTFEQIFNEATDILSYSGKTILLKFLRTFNFIDYLEQLNYLNKETPFTNTDYKKMIINNPNKNKKLSAYIKGSNKYNNLRKRTKIENIINSKKLEKINNLIILLNIYSKEIENFPESIYNEDNLSIKKYIIELIFALHETTNYIYYNNDIINKIMPYYYKLFSKFLIKKNLFILMLNDINKNKTIDINKFKNLVPRSDSIKEDKVYKHISNQEFNIFNKNELFSLALKSLYEIYNNTNINSEISLQKYLEIYDNYNEANFPPFSLFEIKDYEYFYEDKNDKESSLNNEQNNTDLSAIINEKYLEQFKNISMTSFLGILTGDSIDKRVDFGINFTDLFQAFINSTESDNKDLYRSLLCILNKMLFYDCEHIQLLLSDLAYDKNFFHNINRELNYYIIQYIISAKKYELSHTCSEITDITKLTIQFFQLMSEGFNTSFHSNILEDIHKKRRRNSIKNENLNGNNIYSSEEEEFEDDIYPTINNDMIEIFARDQAKLELNEDKEKPGTDPMFSIYESMINNLKIIFYLMKLNNSIEGELAFDKLCILSTNIIDFLIEYIDTKKNLINIIDNNMKNLFFGDKSSYFSKNQFSAEVAKIQILSIFRIRVEEEHELDDQDNINKYKLRKIMLAFMKIKYFHLLKSYIQTGTKKDFIKSLLEHKFGPIQLFEEVIYYMRELVNNLVNKDYEKYNFLLEVDGISSYKKKLYKLYMNEDDFRTSLELNLIFQICIIIKTFEDIYDITMLKEYYKKEQNSEYYNYEKESDNLNKIKKEEEKKIENIFEDESDKEISMKDEESKNEYDKEENDDEDKKNNIKLNADIIYNKKEKNELSRNKNNNYNNNITDNISNTLAPLKTKFGYFSTFNNTNENDNNEDKNNIISLKENPKYNNFKKEEEKNKFSYENILKQYKKSLKSKKIEEIKKQSGKKKIKLSIEELNLRSKFSVAIYKFLFSLISKVEIKIDNSENTDFLKEYNKNRFISKISKQISTKIIDFKNKDKFLLSKSVKEKIDKVELPENDISDQKYKYSNFEENENKVVFFIIPYVCFHLSKRSKDDFMITVDRSSAENKYRSLVKFADYAIFEMMYNMKFVNKFPFVKKISQIKFLHLQIINYIIILLENALLMYHFYKNYSLDPTEYDVINKSALYQKFPDIVIIIAVKLVINLLSFFLWIYCKFPLEFHKHFLFSTEKTFIFRQNGEKNQNINHPTIVKYFQSDEGNLMETIQLITKDTDFLTKAKILFLDTIFFNLDINIFVFSILLNILYLIYSHPLILSIETLFIFGIFPSLLNIFKAFTAKFATLFSCLLFTYLLVYIYNWITIFYFREFFVFEDVFEYKSGQYTIEPFCHSSLQCFLILISYGTRGGGVIGNRLPSFQNDTKLFIGKFVYDITFYILVIMIMGNITFGLIVDSFGELRDDTYNFENDKNNICFICQISRDGCLLKNIDFDSHIKKEHNLWNYVNFLIYLHLNNPNDFSRIEGIVWDKLIEKDFGWVPMDPDAGEEDED